MRLTYPEAVTEIESFGVMPDRPPSLEPMHRALAALDILKRIDPTRVVIVAGTNGKGSTSAMLSQLLESAGCRTGLYTSPHLVETTERIRLGGRDLEPEAFVRSYLAIRSLAVELKLTHFEVLTLMAAWVFFSGQDFQPVDYAVLEVGLGGIWDATNAIPHRNCVITSLGLDHQNLLGNTLAEIARNKFGIVTHGATVVHAPIPAEAQGPAREARERGPSQWFEAPACPVEVQVGAETPRFFAHTSWGRAELALPGARGAQNAGIALLAFEKLGFEPSAYLEALARVRWPGRMERFDFPGAPCPIYLSGDHNPQGIASLLELLPAYPRRELHCLVGVGKDKDLDGILGPLSRLPGTLLHLTQIPFRPRLLWDYGPWLKTARSSHPDPAQALKQVMSFAKKEDLLLVTGSLYLVGAIRRVSNHGNL